MGTKYKHNYLDKVVTKIDFSTPIADFKTGLPQELIKSALKIFPIEERKTITKGSFSIPNGKLRQKEDFPAWLFIGRNREKKLAVTYEDLSITFDKYQSFDEPKNNFLKIIDTLANTNSDLVINRFGLRYINNIQIQEEGNPTDWKEYLNDNLLSIFSVPESKEMIIRAFHNLVLDYGDMYLRFQYGMHNPDFPSRIKTKSFILDYDAYFEGLLDYADIRKKLDIYHDRIEDLFKSCITEKLEKKMNE